MNAPTVGYAQNVITPALDRPVYLAGFGQNRRAESVHDDLYARALAVSDGEHTLAFCALDLIGFFRPDVKQVIAQVQAQRPRVEIVIASTHTHHGPDTMGLWGSDLKTSGVDAAYLAGLRQVIARTLLEALAALQPCAGMRAAAVQVPGVVKNARDPHIVDEELTVLQFVSLDGKPLASLFNFPCHPEVLWEHNPHITADYPGFLRNAVEAQTGAPCLFFAGALGGMLTPDVQEHSFGEAQAIGEKLAAAGLEAVKEAPLRPFPLTIQRLEIRPRLTNILYKLAFRRKLLPDVRDRQGRVATEVSLVQIGGAWLAGVPGELLPKLGLALKAQMRGGGAQVVGVLGLANDELGYILPEEDFKYPWNPFRPGKHYEETNSISKDIALQVMRAFHTLLAG